MKPIIIEVGLNEAVGREQHPLVPSTPDEIAADILDCAAAGASIVHFHARDPDTGEQRFDATELYREAMSAVRSTGCDVHMYPTYPPFLSSGPDPAADRFHHVLELADDPAIGLRVARSRSSTGCCASTTRVIWSPLSRSSSPGTCARPWRCWTLASANAPC
jgi:hypothetical protein